MLGQTNGSKLLSSKPDFSYREEETMVRCKWKLSGGSQERDNCPQDHASSKCIVFMPIPAHLVGLLIGKEGKTIHRLQAQAGVNMFIMNMDQHEEQLPFEQRKQTLKIYGKASGCKFAQQLVNNLISSKNCKVKKVKQNTSTSSANESEATKAAEDSESHATNSEDCLPDLHSKNSVSTESSSAPVFISSDKKKILEESKSNICLMKPSCEFCGLEKNILQEISQLLQNFFHKRQFRCKTCNRIFSTEKKFSNHLHTRSGKACDKAYISYGLNLERQINVLDKDAKYCSKMTFNCEFCPKLLDLQISISEHDSTQQDMMNSILNSLDSGNIKGAVSDSALLFPLQSMQMSPDEACQVSTVQNEHPSSHILKASHSPFRSSVDISDSLKTCERNSFTTPNNKTTSNQAFVCEICNMSFSYLKHLNKHSMTVHQCVSETQKLHQEESSRNCDFQVDSRNTSELPESSLCRELPHRNISKNQGKISSRVSQSQRKARNKTSSDSTEYTKSNESELHDNLLAKYILLHGEQQADKSLSNPGNNDPSCSKQTPFVAHSDHEPSVNRVPCDDAAEKKEHLEIDLTKKEDEIDMIELASQSDEEEQAVINLSHDAMPNETICKGKTVCKTKPKSSVEQGSLYTCKVCLGYFKSLTKLNRHIDKHFNIKLSCNKSNELFDNQSDMDEHSCFHPKRRKVAEDWWS